jgi:YidC/Oxa1 family membrane protein insertase
MSSCLFSFIQLPLFFAFLEAVYRVPAFFETSFLKVFHLGTTPLEGIKAGNYWYIILVILILAATYFSFKNMNSSNGNAQQEQQMKMMSTFMVVFIGIASFSLQTSIALYWIVSNGFTIVQNMVMKKGN